MSAYVPTPMHPSCCSACSKPMLHTCAPHVHVCRACEAAILARIAHTKGNPPA